MQLMPADHLYSSVRFRTKTQKEINFHSLLNMKFFVVTFLLIGILLPTFGNEASSCPENPISNQRLTDFEFDVFRWAPRKDNDVCKKFLDKMQDNTNDELAKIGMCLFDIDCRRFQRALACYQSFYSSTNTSTKAKADLDENKIDDFEEICEEYL